MSLPNVLSVRADQTKKTDDKDTGIPCVTIYVNRKVPERYPSGRRKLRLRDTVPKDINKIPTDVVWLSSPDFKIGKTGVGSLPPHLKKRRMGVIK